MPWQNPFPKQLSAGVRVAVCFGITGNSSGIIGNSAGNSSGIIGNSSGIIGNSSGIIGNSSGITVTALVTVLVSW